MRNKIERFLEKIIITDSGCWEWQSVLSENGYGRFWFNRRFYQAHRFIFEYYHGQICPDLQIHHMCYNTKCANPSHLIQITNKENVLDVGSNSISAINSRKNECPRGHNYSGVNNIGRRICKICGNERTRQFRMKKQRLAQI